MTIWDKIVDIKIRGATLVNKIQFSFMAVIQNLELLFFVKHLTENNREKKKNLRMVKINLMKANHWVPKNVLI